MKSHMRSSFWRGMAVALFGVSFIQDFMGLEAYIAYCREHWVTMSPWWWLLIIALILWLQCSYERDAKMPTP